MSRKCFVPGCKSGYASDRKERKSLGKKNPSIFQGPKDADLLQKWQKVIPRSDRIMSSMDVVCELHFSEDEIERNYVTKLPDGTIHVIERERPHLKKGAVPSIFPNLPKYLSKKVKKRRKPIDRSCTLQDKKIVKFDQPTEDVQISENEDEIRNFSFSTLIQHLRSIKKPSTWWGVTENTNFIVCVKWDLSFKAEKRIIIDTDLKFRIFVHDTEVKDLPPVDLNSLEDVSMLMQIVHGYTLCSTVMKGLKEEKCEVVIPDAGRTLGNRGRPSAWCKACNGTNKKRKDSEDRPQIQHIQTIISAIG